MASLPDELITEILSRLPVKSLLRFRTVCKSWNFLIKTPNFTKTHLNQTLNSKSDRHLYLFNVTHQISEIDLNHHNTHLSFSDLNHPLRTHQGVQLVGSCNGVVCISTFFNDEVVLYNPLTNSHRKLPSIPKPNLDINSIVLGFGYDSKNDDYKVLRIVQMANSLPWPVNTYGSENKAQVYSFNDNSWRCIESIPYHLYYDFIPGVLVNEGLHYLVTQNSLSACLSIGRFDLQTESFLLIECPNYDKRINSKLNFVLADLGGCLCLLINSFVRHELWYYFDPVLEYVELWVMKEYGNKESWVKLFCISQPHIFGIKTYTRALAYSKDDTRVLLEINSSEYCWYDLESRSIERITAHGISDNGFRTTTCIGSLVSLEDKKVSQHELIQCAMRLCIEAMQVCNI